MEWIFQQPKQMLSDNLGEEEMELKSWKFPDKKTVPQVHLLKLLFILMPNLLHHVRKQFKGDTKIKCILIFFVLLQFAWEIVKICCCFFFFLPFP
jgi:hypothetical protein